MCPANAESCYEGDRDPYNVACPYNICRAGILSYCAQYTNWIVVGLIVTSSFTVVMVILSQTATWLSYPQEQKERGLSRAFSFYRDLPTQQYLEDNEISIDQCESVGIDRLRYLRDCASTASEPVERVLMLAELPHSLSEPDQPLPPPPHSPTLSEPLNGNDRSWSSIDVTETATFDIEMDLDLQDRPVTPLFNRGDKPGEDSFLGIMSSSSPTTDEDKREQEESYYDEGDEKRDDRYPHPQPSLSLDHNADPPPKRESSPLVSHYYNSVPPVDRPAPQFSAYGLLSGTLRWIAAPRLGAATYQPPLSTSLDYSKIYGARSKA